MCLFCVRCGKCSMSSLPTEADVNFAAEILCPLCKTALPKETNHCPACGTLAYAAPGISQTDHPTE